VNGKPTVILANDTSKNRFVSAGGGQRPALDTYIWKTVYPPECLELLVPKRVIRGCFAHNNSCQQHTKIECRTGWRWALIDLEWIQIAVHFDD
jgi:hypothetical protein